MLFSVILFTAAFILLWIGSGIAVSSITKISHSLRMSSFFVSFLVLGIFTSLTEIMVGVNAIISNQPEIFVGNLIGSSIVLFLLVIPLLAVIGNGIKLNRTLTFKDLVSIIFVVGIPAVLILDGRLNFIDAIICIIMYLQFVYFQEKKSGNFERLVVMNFNRATIYISIAKVLLAVVIVFLASQLLVSQTAFVAALFGVPPFIISIIIISIGTNIPEISIAARAILAKQKGIAIGNYIGSSSLNTLELGILTLLSKQPAIATGSNFSMLAFILGLALFLHFGKSRNEISRQEGALLLVLYILFILTELLTGPGWYIFN